MSEVDWLKILKWVIIVLIAGFIGQFGKMLATYLVARARKKKKTGSSELQQPENDQEAKGEGIQDIKSEKSWKQQESNTLESFSPLQTKQDHDGKKALKIIAKQKKKESKLKVK